MNYEVNEISSGNYLELELSGKLTREAYEAFLPDIERQIREHGKLHMLVVLNDFHGWDSGALWEDLKFDYHHFRDIERLAIVGESKWEEGMAFFCRPFTSASVKYFDHAQIDAARQWAQSGQVPNF